MTRPPSISVVLPAHNEAAVICDVVRRCGRALVESHVAEAEILVVDDGSGDATRDEALRAAADSPHPVRVISHRVNRGYGDALRTGFEAARCEAIWLMDSDGQFDPSELANLLPAYSPRTAVLGYRMRRRDAVARRFYHWAFFRLVRVLFGPLTSDVNCAYKLFPRELGRGLGSHGAMISTELVVSARRRQYRIAEVGVTHHPRRTGRASGANPKVVLRAFAEMWTVWRRRDELGEAVPPAA